MTAYLITKKDELQNQVDSQLNQGSSVIRKDDGFLAQLTALSDLGRKNSTASTAHWTLGTLFFMIELLPVLVKILTSMGSPGPYEQVQDLQNRTTVDRALVSNNHERDRIDSWYRKQQAIDKDMFDRELTLGKRANAHVAKQMEHILDRALSQWSQNVSQTLNGAAGTGATLPSGSMMTLGTSNGTTPTGQQTANLTAIKTQFNVPDRGKL